MSKWEQNEEIELFREYLRIPSVHPDVDYTECVEFLKRQARNLNLSYDVIYPVVETKPVVIIKWFGEEPTLPAIILNSHMDVVPVFEDKWTHSPFKADIDENGNIFARGAQDMKCVGMQYLAAVRALKKTNYKPKCNIFLTFVPDEEIGGQLGMKHFVQMNYFKGLNVGFSLDEGIASSDDTFLLYFAERTLWHVNFKINGTAGHGSLLLKNTAGEKLNYLLNKFMEYRTRQVQRLENKELLLDIGDVTTVNLTQVSGGVQSNVIPPIMTATFDIRIAITENIEALKNQLHEWCQQAGGDIEIEFKEENEFVKPTKLDNSNPFWIAFKQIASELDLKFRASVFPGATDSRFLRAIGIPALGFSPINNTPVLLHDHDEYLQADIYLRGIEIYKKLIPALASASGNK